MTRPTTVWRTAWTMTCLLICLDAGTAGEAGESRKVAWALEGSELATWNHHARARFASPRVADEWDGAQGVELLADFDGISYGEWQAEGEAFGSMPSRGAVGVQQLSGSMGTGLVNSYAGREGGAEEAVGRLVSPKFKISRAFISFLIGGGPHAGRTCISLLVRGRVVRSSVGQSSDAMRWASWDVRDLRGKNAHLEIIDAHEGSWGHIEIDQIEARDTPRRAEVADPADQESVAASSPARRLGLFGYQIDRDGQGHFPTHDLPHMCYDLALSIPVGTVKVGKRFKLERTYEHLRGHAPVLVKLAGEVTAIDGDLVSFRATGEGKPPPRFDRERRPRWQHRVAQLHAELEGSFDTRIGLLREAQVHLATTVEHRDAAGAAARPPPPTSASHEARFELHRMREHHPGRLDPAVGSAIARGVEWLRARSTGGGYPGMSHAGLSFPDGQTSLVALTLLVCGAPRDDPLVLRLMERVRAANPVMTYELGCSLMALEAFHSPANEVALVHAGRAQVPRRREIPPADRERVQAWVDALLQIARRLGHGIEWCYSTEWTNPDLSNTQYATLGLLSAQRCGIEVDEDLWIKTARGALHHLAREQTRQALHLLPVGQEVPTTFAGRMVTARGYNYRSWEEDPRASIAGCALGTLAICHDVLALRRARSLPKISHELRRGIDSGWAWLARHWSIQRHAPDRGQFWHLYNLYSLERAAVLCKVSRVNGRDWYHEGASWLVEIQEADGHWENLHDTCFALLFLKRGTLPVTTDE